MKKITIAMTILIGIITINNIAINKIDDDALRSIFKLDNLAYSEVTIIPAQNNVDAPKACQTTKMVQVTVGDGKFEWKTISVRGMENPCKPQEGAVCQSYACYAN